MLAIGKALGEQKPVDLAVIDLINNARRRMEEGKFDDATARLYRACELLEQWRLHEKFGIDTRDVDPAKVPEQSRKWLEGCRDRHDDVVRIGCARGYQLLTDFGDELGPRYGDLKGKLKARNDSILAHGLTPVSGEACRSLLEVVESLARDVVPDYAAKTALLRFPWSQA